MGTFIVAPEAEDDVFQIWQYLYLHAGPAIASRIEGEILDVFSGLAETPGKGHRRPDLTRARVLFYTIYQYMVVYRNGNPVQILGVLHGKREVDQILNNRL